MDGDREGQGGRKGEAEGRGGKGEGERDKK